MTAKEVEPGMLQRSKEKASLENVVKTPQIVTQEKLQSPTKERDNEFVYHPLSEEEHIAIMQETIDMGIRYGNMNYKDFKKLGLTEEQLGKYGFVRDGNKLRIRNEKESSLAQALTGAVIKDIDSDGIPDLIERNGQRFVREGYAQKTAEAEEKETLTQQENQKLLTIVNDKDVSEDSRLKALDKLSRSTPAIIYYNIHDNLTSGHYNITHLLEESDWSRVLPVLCRLSAEQLDSIRTDFLTSYAYNHRRQFYNRLDIATRQKKESEAKRLLGEK